MSCSPSYPIPEPGASGHPFQWDMAQAQSWAGSLARDTEAKGRVWIRPRVPGC